MKNTRSTSTLLLASIGVALFASQVLLRLQSPSMNSNGSGQRATGSSSNTNHQDAQPVENYLVSSDYGRIDVRWNRDEIIGHVRQRLHADIRDSATIDAKLVSYSSALAMTNTDPGTYDTEDGPVTEDLDRLVWIVLVESENLTRADERSLNPAPVPALPESEGATRSQWPGALIMWFADTGDWRLYLTLQGAGAEYGSRTAFDALSETMP